jgi:hypothetical protein
MICENISTSHTEREHARRRRCGFKLLLRAQTPLGGRAKGWLAGVALAALTSFGSAQSCVTPVGASGEGTVIIDLEVEGSLVFAASFYSGLRILDIHDPAAPTEVGAYAAVDIVDVEVVGTTAYLLGSRQLELLDVSDPTTPVLLGSIQFADPCFCIKVVDGLAYVGEYQNYDNQGTELRIIDVSSPTAPVEVGEVLISGSDEGISDIEVIGTTAFLTVFHWLSGPSFVQTVDIVDPAAPALLGNYSLAQPFGRISQIEVIGGVAYCPYWVWDADSSESGILILDVSDRTQPVELSRLNAPAGNSRLEIDGMRAYLTLDLHTLGSDLTIFDISDPTAPVEIGSYDTDTKTVDIRVVARYAYVASWDGLDASELLIFDVADCSSCFDPCEADFNDDGTVNTQDFIAFLNAWAAGCE